jgi:hypothetical protein
MSLGSDPRSRKVAVVAESLLPELLDRLDEEGYGVIQLPPAGLDRETAALWLEQVAEHVAEFVRNDYEVVLADDGSYSAELADAVAALGIGPLASYPPANR